MKTKLGEYYEHIQAHLAWPELPSYEDKTRFLALALAGEAGELCNLIKKDWRGDPGNRRQAIVKEITDVLGYGFMLAKHLGIEDPLQEMLDKLLEVEQRLEWQTHLKSRKTETQLSSIIMVSELESPLVFHRDRYAFKLGMKYALLQPLDLVRIKISETAFVTLKITHITEGRETNVLDVSAEKFSDPSIPP